MCSPMWSSRARSSPWVGLPPPCSLPQRRRFSTPRRSRSEHQIRSRANLGCSPAGARSLLTRKLVTPGTNGGVSALGEAWAFVGAFTTALVGAGLFRLFGQPVPPLGTFLLGVTLAGFLGCQVDSLLGETLENRHYLSKGGTNLVAMFITVLIAWGLLAALGSGPG